MSIYTRKEMAMLYDAPNAQDAKDAKSPVNNGTFCIPISE